MPKDAIPANHKQVLEFFKNECEIDENGNIVTKTLYSIDKAGKFHYWNGYVGIAECDGSEELIPVDKELVLERLELPDENCGIYWTQYGHEGGVETTSASTYVVTGKNIGKNNETSPLTQAILDLRTQYNKKITTGNSPDKTTLIGSGTVLTMETLLARKGIEFPWRVYPMADTMSVKRRIGNTLSFHVIFNLSLMVLCLSWSVIQILKPRTVTLMHTHDVVKLLKIVNISLMNLNLSWKNTQDCTLLVSYGNQVRVGKILVVLVDVLPRVRHQRWKNKTS